MKPITCSTCERIATLKITKDVFLCDRCSAVMAQEFPNFVSASHEHGAEHDQCDQEQCGDKSEFHPESLPPVASSPGVEAPAAEQPPSAPAAAGADFPELPAFLDCRSAA